MESGKTMFFSLNQPQHWQRRGISGNLEATADGISLKRSEKYALLDSIDDTDLEEVGTITAFAVGPMNDLALLNEQGEVWRYDRISRACEQLFISGHGLFSASAKLAITGDSLLVADRLAKSGEAVLASIDMASGQLRWRHSGDQVEGMPLCPLTIASDENGVYVLTPKDEWTSHEQGNPFMEENRQLAIIKFALSGSVEAVITDPSFQVRMTAQPEDWEGIVYLHRAPDGGVCALDSRGRQAFTFGADGQLVRSISLPQLSCAGLAVDSHNQLYFGESRYILDGVEDDRFIHGIGADGQPLESIGGYRGKTDDLEIDAKDRLYIFNGEDRTITVLELQQRTRGWTQAGVPEGVWLSRAFDSTEAETVWHKFTLDADIPDGTMLRVRYFSSDQDEMIIADAHWKVDDWLARSDLSWGDKLDALASFWSPPVVNPTDALIFGAQGRYLWMIIEWIGSENATPKIRKLRLYFPRETLLSYLPAVYQEEESSQDFLERFLSLFGTLFDSVETQMDDMAAQFDPEIVHGRQLRWLASWLGLSCDEHWSDDWVRRLIRAAPVLYRYRGTRRGIETLIETLTGRKPIIIEAFQYRKMREQGDLRWLTDQLYGDNPFAFTLLLHEEQAPSDKERELLRQLVDDHKPVHTQVQILWLQPWMYLDLHTYLGVNTMLAEPSLLSLESSRSMPNDTLIVDRDMDKRMDAYTRLEMDSELE